MTTKNKNEEILSRRGFFKKAAKGALPILGIVALTQMPFFVTEVRADCSECSGSCVTNCSGSCGMNSCGGGCHSGCGGTCYTTCKGGCGGCTGTCSHTCTGGSGW